MVADGALLRLCTLQCAVTRVRLASWSVPSELCYPPEITNFSTSVMVSSESSSTVGRPSPRCHLPRPRPRPRHALSQRLPLSHPSIRAPIVWSRVSSSRRRTTRWWSRDQRRPPNQDGREGKSLDPTLHSIRPPPPLSDLLNSRLLGPNRALHRRGPRERSSHDQLTSQTRHRLAVGPRPSWLRALRWSEFTSASVVTPDFGGGFELIVEDPGSDRHRYVVSCVLEASFEPFGLPSTTPILVMVLFGALFQWRTSFVISTSAALDPIVSTFLTSCWGRSRLFGSDRRARIVGPENLRREHE